LGLFVTNCKHGFVAFGDFCGKLWEYCAFKAGVMGQTSNLLYLNTNQSTAKGFLFGLQIPFLPDFLLDHTLLGKEPSDRIQEYSRRWTEFVSG
jgi:hypothetical protein